MQRASGRYRSRAGGSRRLPSVAATWRRPDALDARRPPTRLDPPRRVRPAAARDAARSSPPASADVRDLARFTEATRHAQSGARQLPRARARRDRRRQCSTSRPPPPTSSLAPCRRLDRRDDRAKVTALSVPVRPRLRSRRERGLARPRPHGSTAHAQCTADEGLRRLRHPVRLRGRHEATSSPHGVPRRAKHITRLVRRRRRPASPVRRDARSRSRPGAAKVKGFRRDGTLWRARSTLAGYGLRNARREADATGARSSRTTAERRSRDRRAAAMLTAPVRSP